MSVDQDIGPSGAVQQASELESLIQRVVDVTIAQIEATEPRKPFITSRECARLIGVTPEHLSAMRARGEGPPWSGEGKWIRYERRAVFDWLAGLPREKTAHDAVARSNIPTYASTNHSQANRSDK